MSVNSRTSSAPAWSVRLMEELDANDRAATDLVNGLTVEQINRQPEPGTWSVGQCIEHLCIGNDVYLPAIVAALDGKFIAPVQDVVIGWFGSWFIRNYIEPSPRTKRASAPKKIAPGSRVEASILDRFLSGNQRVRELIQRAAAHDVNRVRFKNPFIPGIRFTVGTGLTIICAHERRHLLQARRAKEELQS